MVKPRLGQLSPVFSQIVQEGEEISGDHNAGLAPLLQNLSDLLHKVAGLHRVCKRKVGLGLSGNYSYLYLSQSVHDILQIIK